MKGWRWTCGSLCAGMLVLNAWHLAVDRSSPSWDDALHLEVSFRLFYALKEGLAAFVQQYIGACRFKAPLLSLLALPLYAAFGPGERVALWVNEAALAASLWLTCRIGTRLFHEKAGLAAAAALSLMPLVYGVSRVFFPESALLALVLWSLLLILEARAEDRRGGLMLGLALGLGLLVKVSFPAFLLGPVWLRRRELGPHLKQALLTGGLIAGSWYAFNGPYVLGHALSSGFGRLSQDYGISAANARGFLIFLEQLALQTWSWQYCLCAAALLALARLGARPHPGPWRLGEAGRFLLSWAALPVLLIVLSGNRQTRYLAPVFPALALLLGAAAADLGRTSAGKAAALCLTLPLLWVASSQTLGVPRPRPMFFNAPAVRLPAWDRAALITVILDRVPDRAVVAVGLELPELNANNLASLAASRGAHITFVNLLSGGRGVEDALIRLKDKSADYLVMFRGRLPESVGTQYAFLNGPNVPLQERIDDGRLPSQRLASAAVAPEVEAVLYRLKRSRS